MIHHSRKDDYHEKVIKSGEGAQPIANDSVTVRYRGTLLDGKVFDVELINVVPASEDPAEEAAEPTQDAG